MAEDGALHFGPAEAKVGRQPALEVLSGPLVGNSGVVANAQGWCRRSSLIFGFPAARKDVRVSVSGRGLLRGIFLEAESVGSETGGRIAPGSRAHCRLETPNGLAALTAEGQQQPVSSPAWESNPFMPGRANGSAALAAPFMGDRRHGSIPFLHTEDPK